MSKYTQYGYGEPPTLDFNLSSIDFAKSSTTRRLNYKLSDEVDYLLNWEFNILFIVDMPLGETNGLVSTSLRNNTSNPIRFTLPARTHWLKTQLHKPAPHVFIQRVR